MATSAEPLLRHIRRLLAPSDKDASSDAALLERYVRQRDEAAFTALLARHGPMVLGVCRRVLRDSHEAEDAFQATFLVLARKVGTLRRPESLASWLYGTARHLALAARRADVRRRQREARCLEAAPPSSQGDLLDELSARELLLTLDEEMVCLPETYRLPLILCYLEGHTHEEAARWLGWTAGSVKGRLERGRARLHGRLVRRGLILSAALLPAVLTSGQAAGVRASLLDATLQASRAFATGVGDGVAREVWALAETAIKGVTAAKVKLGLLLLLALGIAAGAGTLAYPTRSGKTPAEEPPAPERQTATPNPDRAGQARTDRYGDPLPAGAMARMGTVRFRHGDVIEGISLSDDGRTIVAASRDRTVRVWDVATGRELRRLPGQEGPGPAGFGSLRYVAFSPDGKLLATGVSYSGIVRLWDTATWKELRKLQSPDRGWLGHVAFSADGKLVAASANNHCIMLWETDTGRLVHQLDGGEKNTFAGPIAFSPDERMLASGGLTETLRLWDLKTGKEIRRLRVQPPGPKEKSDPPHLSGLVEAVVFSHDGLILASAAKDAPVRLWDVATGKVIRSLPGNRYGAYSLAFAPDGKTLASGEAEGAIRVWETATGKEVRRIQAHGAFVSGLAFIHDGKTLITSGDSAIRLWEVRTGVEIVPDRGHTTGIHSSVVLPDGRTVVTGSEDYAVRWWDLATGKELRRLASLSDGAPSWGMVLSPNGAIAAYHRQKSVSDWEGHLGIELWDLTAWKKLALLWRPNIFSVQFSPDSKTLYTQVADILSKEQGSLILAWDVATGKEMRIVAKNTNGFDGFRMSADGKVLAATTYERGKTIFVWDVATGKELCRIPGDAHLNQSLAISPDNKLLAVADGPPPQAGGNEPPHDIRLWDIATGKEVRRFGRSKNAYWQVAFSADGRTLATADADNQLQLWETATGGERLRFAGHAGRIGNLIFAENDRTLVSTSSDTTALVWDVTGLRGRTPDAGDKQLARNLQDLWDALADPDAATAYRAIWGLTAIPGEAVAFLREHLRRVEPPDEKIITELVQDLDSPTFATRQRASEALAELDRLAEPALRKALTDHPSLEMRRRVQQLLEQLAAVPSGVQMRPLRAVEVLENLGTPPAWQVLETLASDATDARLTQEAKASLARLTRRPSAQP
jgi:RNA polymerase sigma factor (sigma-70 family)